MTAARLRFRTDMADSMPARWSKRTTDVVLAAVGLVVALPLIVAVCVASAVTLRTSPLFVHRRVGRGGHTFAFVKIRTLPPSVDPYCEKGTVDLARVPRLMRAVRRAHLDELPQLLLVLTGAMSLVGPRPEMPRLHARLDPAFAAARITVRPGITGLWQIGPHCTGAIGDHPEYDLTYLEERSLRLDLWILFATVRKALRVRTTPLGASPAWVSRSRTGSGAADMAEPAPQLVASGWQET